MVSTRTRNVLSFGAGVALTGVYFGLRDQFPSVEPAPIKTSLSNLIRHSEALCGEKVEVEGQLASEVYLEFCETRGSEWWPSYDSKTDVASTTRLDYQRPEQLGYWYLLANPSNSSEQVLVYSPNLVELPVQSSATAAPHVAFVARVHLRPDGTPFLESEARDPSDESDDESVRSARRYLFCEDGTRGYVVPQAELRADAKSPAVSIQELTMNPTKYLEQSVTLSGEPRFLGAEPVIVSYVHGLERFKGLDQMRLLSAPVPEVGEGSPDLEDMKDFMRSQAITNRSTWYELRSGNDRVLVRRLEGALPVNTNAVRGWVRQADGKPPGEIEVWVQEFGTRAPR